MCVYGWVDWDKVYYVWCVVCECLSSVLFGIHVNQRIVCMQRAFEYNESFFWLNYQSVDETLIRHQNKK
jgi:hypothetical protein